MGGKPLSEKMLLFCSCFVYPKFSFKRVWENHVMAPRLFISELSTLALCFVAAYVWLVVA
jgi:hypothetical protein